MQNSALRFLVGLIGLTLGAGVASADEALWQEHMVAAGTAYERGLYAETERLLQAALKEGREFPPEDPRLASTLRNLALLYRLQGRYGEAEPLIQRALTIWENAFGPENPAVAAALNTLALVRHDRGHVAEAERLYRRALAIRIKARGPDYPEVAGSLNNLGALFLAQGKYVEAELFLQRALTISENAFGPEHPNVTQSLNDLGAPARPG